MDRIFITLTFLYLSFCSFAEEKKPFREIKLGVGVGALYVQGPTNMFIPTFLFAVPLHDRLTINVDYGKIFPSFNKNIVTKGSSLNVNSELILVNLYAVKFFIKLGINNYRQYNYHQDQQYTNLAGHYFGFGVKVSLNKSHTFYEERRIYNNSRWGDETIRSSNSLIGHYREINIKIKRNKYIKTKSYHGVKTANPHYCPTNIR